ERGLASYHACEGLRVLGGESEGDAGCDRKAVARGGEAVVERRRLPDEEAQDRRPGGDGAAGEGNARAEGDRREGQGRGDLHGEERDAGDGRAGAGDSGGGAEGRRQDGVGL